MIITADEAVEQDPARPARLHRHRLRPSRWTWCARSSRAAASWPTREIVHLLTFGDAPYAHQALTRVLPRQQLLHRRKRARDHPGRARRLHARSSCPTSRACSIRPDAAGRGADPGDARRTARACAAWASRWTSSRAPRRTPRWSSPRSTRNMPRTLGDSFLHVDDLDILVPGRRAAHRECTPPEP